MFGTVFDTDLTKFTDLHLSNRLKYFRKKLANMPVEAIYIGDSVYAEDAVNSENAHNEALAEDIKIHMGDIKEEIKRRKGK